MSPGRVAREFQHRLDAGALLAPAGSARKRPGRLLSAGYRPRFKLQLFDTSFYLTSVRQNDDIRFFVGYVANDLGGSPARTLHPRIFYKDVSLIWRSASHYVRSNRENWIGKGALRVYEIDGEPFVSSDEATTDLPLEIQTAFETLMRRTRRPHRDDAAVGLVLRRGPDDRIEAYRDFTAPRQRAQADRRNLINGGRPIARFTRRNDPTSLRFTSGFEPDFDRILDESQSASRLYGGRLRRWRLLSKNEKVQYLFMSGPHHVWIIPPQATTTELSSYGVRTIDVRVDDDLCVPGFEYHSLDDPELAQIPEGFAGEPSEHDASRSDASPWLDQLPVVREFRRRVLRQPSRATVRGERR